VTNLGDLVLLDKSWVESASRMLARAFWHYPMVQCVLPDEAERHRRVSHFFDFILRYGIRYGEVYASSPNLEGVAVWVPSDSWPTTLWRLLRSGTLGSMFRIGAKAGRQMQPFGRHTDATHERLAPFKHWYL